MTDVHTVSARLDTSDFQRLETALDETARAGQRADAAVEGVASGTQRAGAGARSMAGGVRQAGSATQNMVAQARAATGSLSSYGAAMRRTNAHGQAYTRTSSTAGFATANLAAQFNDIGVMMASGQSPFLLAVQQGTQVNQVLTQMRATGAPLRQTLVSAFTSIISPLSLVTVGLIAGGAAFGQWVFGAITAGGETRSLADVLEDAEGALGDLKSATDDATLSMEDMTDRFGAGTERMREYLEIVRQIEGRRLGRQIAAAGEAALGDISGFFTDVQGGADALFNLGPVFDKLERAQRQFTAPPDINAADIFQGFGPRPEQARQFTEEMEEYARRTEEAQSKVADLRQEWIEHNEALARSGTDLDAQVDVLEALIATTQKLARADGEVTAQEEDQLEIYVNLLKMARERQAQADRTIETEDDAANAARRNAEWAARQLATMQERAKVAQVEGKYGKDSLDAEHARYDAMRAALEGEIERRNLSEDIARLLRAALEMEIEGLQLSKDRARWEKRVSEEKRAQEAAERKMQREFERTVREAQRRLEAEANISRSLSHQTTVSEAILAYGRDSVQVRRAEAAIQRELFEVELDRARITGKARDTLIAKYERLARLDAQIAANEPAFRRMNTLVGDIATAWGDWVAGGFDDFKSFTDRVKDAFRRLLADMIAQAAAKPLMSLLFGGAATAVTVPGFEPRPTYLDRGGERSGFRSTGDPPTWWQEPHGGMQQIGMPIWGGASGTWNPQAAPGGRQYRYNAGFPELDEMIAEGIRRGLANGSIIDPQALMDRAATEDETRRQLGVILRQRGPGVLPRVRGLGAITREIGGSTDDYMRDVMRRLDEITVEEILRRRSADRLRTGDSPLTAADELARGRFGYSDRDAQDRELDRQMRDYYFRMQPRWLTPPGAQFGFRPASFRGDGAAPASGGRDLTMANWFNARAMAAAQGSGAGLPTFGGGFDLGNGGLNLGNLMMMYLMASRPKVGLGLGVLNALGAGGIASGGGLANLLSLGSLGSTLSSISELASGGGIIGDLFGAGGLLSASGPGTGGILGGIFGLGGATSAAGTIGMGVGSAATFSAVNAAAASAYGTGLSGGLSAAMGSGAGIFSIGTNAGLAGGGFGATIGAALPAIGVVVGAMALLGVFQSKKTLIDSEIGLSISEMDTLVQTFDRYKKSSLFGLKRSRFTDERTLSDEDAAPIRGAVDTIRTEIADAAAALGLGADALSTFTTEVRFSVKGLDEAARQAKVEEVLGGIRNEMAAFALEGTELEVALGDAAERLTTLAGALTGVNAVLESMGHAPFATGVGGALLAEDLAGRFGGVGNFQSAAQTYYTAFHSEAERMDDTRRRITDALAELNTAMPETAAQYRALVEAQDLSTEKGRELYTALLQLAGGFNAVLDYEARLTAERAAAASAAAQAAEAEKERIRQLEDSYRSRFHSEGERMGALFDSLPSNLQEMLSGFLEGTGDVAETFRGAVEAAAALGDEGRELYVSLLENSAAARTLADYEKRLAEERAQGAEAAQQAARAEDQRRMALLQNFQSSEAFFSLQERADRVRNELVSTGVATGSLAEFREQVEAAGEALRAALLEHQGQVELLASLEERLADERTRAAEATRRAAEAEKERRASLLQSFRSSEAFFGGAERIDQLRNRLVSAGVDTSGAEGFRRQIEAAGEGTALQAALLEHQRSVEQLIALEADLAAQRERAAEAARQEERRIHGFLRAARFAHEAFAEITLGTEYFSEDLMRLGRQLSGMFGDENQALSGLAGYYQNFSTEDERIARTRRELAQAFFELEVAAPRTRREFRALVEGADLTTEAGRALFAGLIKVADQFAEVTREAQTLDDALQGPQGLFRSLSQEIFVKSAPELRNLQPAGGDINALLRELIQLVQAGNISAARQRADLLDEQRRDRYQPTQQQIDMS